MTRLDAVREIVSAFDAVAQEHSDTAEEFEGDKQRCREALAALGVGNEEIEEALAAATDAADGLADAWGRVP